MLAAPHRDRRPQPAAWPLLRTVHDLGDVGALTARPDAAPTLRLAARIRASPAHAKSLIELTLMSKPTTLYDKIWDDHLVHEADDGTCLLYIDRHLVHEVTSPQAFEGLRATGRKVHAPEKTLAVVDHNIPTTDRSKPNPDPESIEQMRVMADNAKEFGIDLLQRARQASGHRARHRPRAGLYPARHHHRLRRQPHLDAWRVRRAGARHRHLRGRARAGDADADPEEGQEHARRRRRQIARRRHRQGHHPGHHRRDRHRRRHRLCAGICRRGDPRAHRWKAA